MSPEGGASRCELNSDGEDTFSTTGSEEEEEEARAGVVALRDADEPPAPPSFGNVSVMNSSDIHFGNKTFYQGPVTIKQFLYAGGDVIEKKTDCELVLDAAAVGDGVDNPTFVEDFPAKAAAEKSDARGDRNAGIVAKGYRRLQKFSQQNTVVLVSLLALLMVSLAILMVVLLLRHNSAPAEEGLLTKDERDEQEKNTPIASPIDPKGNLTLPKKLKLVSRLEWLAQPPVEAPTPLALPVPYVIIQHTATENCSSQAQCIFHVRFIQTFHIESRNWWDIGYNFLVGGDGEAYEGRGWKSEGSHTYGYNAKSIGIAFIGTFNTVGPPERQLTACRLLIEKGVELGYVQKDYKLLAARQLQTTQSPGQVLYEEIKKWPHWSETP